MAIEKVGKKRVPGYNITLTCEDTQCSDLAALNSAKRLAKADTGGWRWEGGAWSVRGAGRRVYALRL